MGLDVHDSQTYGLYFAINAASIAVQYSNALLLSMTISKDGCSAASLRPDICR